MLSAEGASWSDWRPGSARCIIGGVNFADLQHTGNMASDRSFVDYVVDQFADDCAVTYRMMFGEYGVYGGGKLFALICDNRLFFKPTDGGRAFIGDVVEAPAYPGAKSSFLIEDRIDDADWLSELARITIREVPAPKAKKRRGKSG